MSTQTVLFVEDGWLLAYDTVDPRKVGHEALTHRSCVR